MSFVQVSQERYDQLVDLAAENRALQAQIELLTSSLRACYDAIQADMNPTLREQAAAAEAISARAALAAPTEEERE